MENKTAPAPKLPVVPCYCKSQPSGGLSVTFQIGPLETQRLKSRAGPMPLDRYLWENVLKQAISSAVF